MDAAKRVVMADTHPAVIRAASRILEQAGVSVTLVASGVDLLVRVGLERPDAVLVDRHCPELDALDIGFLLRRRRAFSALPVVLLTDRPQRFEVLRARAMGISAVLGKPFGRDELLGSLGLDPGRQGEGADRD